MHSSWPESGEQQQDDKEQKTMTNRSGSDQRIVTTLMRYCILPSQTPNAADIHAFHEMAIRSLVRRLRRNQERCALDNLVRAIQTGDRETGCIRIPRSLDGRMQVRQKKTIPHVLYCQIWRWNDLKTYHEIQGIVTCRYAYDMSQSNGEICVNPYHYERIVHTSQQRLQDYHHHHEHNGYPSILVDNQHEQHSIHHDNNYPLPAINHSPFYATPDEYRPHHDPTHPNDPPPDQSSWSRVVYYEMKDKCGEFNVYANELQIDNGTHPFVANRFCLGHIPNIKRTECTERVRCSLGKGIKLTGGFGSSEIHLENQTQSKVFVQSANWNKLENKSVDLVRPILPGQRCKIFDKVSFSLKLQERTNSNDFYRVTQMVHDCKIRVSLVKGWGGEYRRTQADQCEVWFEIELLECLSWLDHVLNHMSPPRAVSSGSDHCNNGGVVKREIE